MNLADYDRKHFTNLVQEVKDLQTRARDLKAFEGMQRLALVSEHFVNLSLEQAYFLLNPEAFRREVEEVQAYKARSKFSQIVRTILGLSPLIVTWGSLSWAVFAYGNYVSSHQKDQLQILSFLQLWQNGSLGGLTFFWTGIFDVSLLILFLSVSLYSLRLEYQARNEAEKFASDLQNVANQLMQAVVTEGQNGGPSDAEIQRVVRFIKEAIAESYQELGELVDKAKDTIIASGVTMQDTFDKQVKPMLTNFDNNIKRFHNDLNTLNTKVQEISNASQSMAGSASAMAGSAASMAGSTSGLATNVQTLTQISRDMDNHLVALNRTEQQMMQTIDQGQRTVAAEVVRAANDMKKSADKLEVGVGMVENIGKQLAIINPQDVQRMASTAKTFADNAGQVATELQNAAKAIKASIRSPWWKRII